MRLALLLLAALIVLPGCVVARVAGDVAEGAVRTAGDVAEGVVDDDEKRDRED